MVGARRLAYKGAPSSIFTAHRAWEFSFSRQGLDKGPKWGECPGCRNIQSEEHSEGIHTACHRTSQATHREDGLYDVTPSGGSFVADSRGGWGRELSVGDVRNEKTG